MPLQIFEFTDYRRFMYECYRIRKQVDAKFSHRFIAAQVRAHSAGWFADIVKGRTNLSGAHIPALARLLRLDQAETDYFECLVHFDQSASVEEKNRHYRKLLALKGVKPEVVGKERFEYYSEWYHAVIREILYFHDFRGNYAGLARKLLPPIGAAEAKRSIRLLESLGFIRKEASGAYRPTGKTLKKDPSFKSLHLANFMTANIALGLQSLESLPKEERDISTMTLSLSPEAFASAREELRALRERLLAMTESDDRPDRVYQFNFHAFPVSE